MLKFRSGQMDEIRQPGLPPAMIEQFFVIQEQALFGEDSQRVPLDSTPSIGFLLRVF